VALASLRPLRSRNFALIWSAALVSNLGSWMQTVALSVLVYARTDKPAWAGLVAAAGFVPIGLLAPVGGALADRLDRRKWLILTTLAETLFAVILAVLAGLHHDPPWALVILSFLGGACGAIGFPAYQAMVPDLVPKEDLLGAVSLSSAQYNLGRVIGPALAGLVLLSQNYALNLSGSRYFLEHPPITDYADLDRRMRSGELSLAIEIPSGFARDVQRGTSVQIGAWIDGAMPQRAETVQGYVQGMHQSWLIDLAKTHFGQNFSNGAATIETRFRYNPDVKSLPSMVPAVIPLLLLMIPAMLTALSVVREKELGSIINLYVTPVTRAEFLIGKQLPYIALAMLNFLLMTLLTVTLFDVPVKGSFMTLLLATLIFVSFSTGFGLFASTFTRSQIAAMFFAMIGSMLPAIQFAGMINPVSSLEGVGRVIGEIYPAAYYMTISRGVFNKALGMADLQAEFAPMVLAALFILGLSIALLKKQEK